MVQKLKLLYEKYINNEQNKIRTCFKFAAELSELLLLLGCGESWLHEHRLLINSIYISPIDMF